MIHDTFNIVNNFIIPNKNKQQEIINLTKSKSAWLSVTWLSEELLKYAKENFDNLYNLKPIERGKVVLYDDEVNTQRWYKSYLQTPLRGEIHTNRSYMYAGKEQYENIELPSLFQPFLDALNKHENEDKYNQVIVNWYANGNDYIAAHSDCQLYMKPDAGIAILSLYENENDYRILQFTPKKNADIDNDFIYPSLKIAAINGSIITMHGDTQQKFRHSLPKDFNITTARISITCRKF